MPKENEDAQTPANNNNPAPAEEKLPEHATANAAISESYEAFRQAEMTALLDGDPEMTKLDELHKDANAPAPAPAEPPSTNSDNPEQKNPEDAKNPSDSPQVLANDVLADYIEIVDDKPFLKTTVNGEKKLMPLDRARAEAQKRDAADAVLQQAKEFRRGLTEREKNLKIAEEALNNQIRAANNQGQPSAPVTADVNRDVILPKAKAAVATLFSGTEDEATETLTSLLVDTVQGRTPAPPPVDVNFIAQQAASIASNLNAAERKKQEIASGFAAFESEFPDLISDPGLFKQADAYTDVIAEEHPEWSPTQVMLEAGNRTRDWLSELRGGAPQQAEPQAPEPVSTPAPAQQSSNARLANKANLVAMPEAASKAFQDQGAAETAQTPLDVINEMRRSRGQGV